jgi:hypothetical protein
MNEKIKLLAEQAGMVLYPTGLGISENTIWGDRNIAKFAELIVQECTDTCRKLWYEENNRKDIPDHEDPRSVGFHSGMKAGIAKCTNELGKLK